MDLLIGFWNGVKPIIPATLMTVGVVGFLVVAHRLLERRQARSGHPGFVNQLSMLGLTLAGLIAVIMVLPINDTTRGQLLSLLGILLTAAIALSSTTIVGNAMAGVMIRAVRNFRSGDYLRVGEHFGRVSERGLFHTEIQTETRELTTLPNLYLVSHPVTVIRSSGTIVSTTLSLGYDVDRHEIEANLITAAGSVGLEEPFVHIMELGDFSVTYRISGLLTDIDRLLTVQARLRSACVDTLHGAGIEIVSPNFMNTRAYPEDRQFITRPKQAAAAKDEGPPPEDVVFDKAQAVSRAEQERAELTAEMEKAHAKLKEAKDDAEAKERAAKRVSELEEQAKELDARIAGREPEREH